MMVNWEHDLYNAYRAGAGAPFGARAGAEWFYIWHGESPAGPWHFFGYYYGHRMQASQVLAVLASTGMFRMSDAANVELVPGYQGATLAAY